VEVVVSEIYVKLTVMQQKKLRGFLNTVSTDGDVVRKVFHEEGLVKIPPIKRYEAEIRGFT
jgi:hypothetical protein